MSSMAASIGARFGVVVFRFGVRSGAVMNPTLPMMLCHGGETPPLPMGVAHIGIPDR